MKKPSRITPSPVNWTTACFGREHELALHVISPFHPDFERIDHLKLQAIGRPELLIVLPADDRLIRDLTLYKQTEKYILQNITLTQQETVKRILSGKTFTNKKRHADLVETVKDALGNARMFVAASEVEAGSHDANLRIHDGFEVLARTPTRTSACSAGLRTPRATSSSAYPIPPTACSPTTPPR